MVCSQFGSIRVAGPDIFVLDVIPATVHVEPVSRLEAQESHKTIGGEVAGGMVRERGGWSAGSFGGARSCNVKMVQFGRVHRHGYHVPVLRYRVSIYIPGTTTTVDYDGGRVQRAECFLSVSPGNSSGSRRCCIVYTRPPDSSNITVLYTRSIIQQYVLFSYFPKRRQYVLKTRIKNQE